MRLAKELGYVDVDAMLASASSRQVTEWIAFYTIQQEDKTKALLEQRVAQKVQRRNKRGR